MRDSYIRPISIVVADDDEEDCMLIREAMEESRLANNLHFVHDGEELMAYLLHQPPYEDSSQYPLPGLILLDLNMPRKDGREALQEIKGHPCLQRIPVVVLTTSQAEEDICRSYSLGVNSYITKPVTFASMLDIVKVLGKYWFEIVELPRLDSDQAGRGGC